MFILNKYMQNWSDIYLIWGKGINVYKPSTAHNLISNVHAMAPSQWRSTFKFLLTTGPLMSWSVPNIKTDITQVRSSSVANYHGHKMFCCVIINPTCVVLRCIDYISQSREVGNTSFWRIVTPFWLYLGTCWFVTASWRGHTLSDFDFNIYIQRPS